MNKCANIQRLIPAALDGELDSPKVDLLKRHVKSCNECRTVYQKEELLHREISKSLIAEAIEAPQPEETAGERQRTRQEAPLAQEETGYLKSAYGYVMDRIETVLYEFNDGFLSIEVKAPFGIAHFPAIPAVALLIIILLLFAAPIHGVDLC